MTPRFSVVIPTRDRPHTLPFALTSVLGQTFGDLELVVSDNSTTDRTAELLAGVDDPRLRVVRTAGDLSMARNWELALSRCTGEYVIYLGDDDALLPHALGELDRLLRRTGARALRWEFAMYTWPDVGLAADASVLVVPLARSLASVDARARFRHVGANPASYPVPMVIHGAVERRLLEELRGASGALFRGVYPDVYSGLAVAARVTEFWESSLPFSVAGLSGTSTGVSLHYDSGREGRGQQIREAFRDMNARDGVLAHPRVPVLTSITSAVLDSWCAARDHHLPDEPALDRRQLARALFESITPGYRDRERVEAARVRASLADRAEDLAWFDRLAAAPRERPPWTLMPRWRGVRGDLLVADAARLGVTDAGAAARHVATLLGLDGGAVEYDQPRRQELLDAERAIREAAAEAWERERGAILRSSSWRLTAPLRSAGTLVARLISG